MYMHRNALIFYEYIIFMLFYLLILFEFYRIIKKVYEPWSKCYIYIYTQTEYNVKIIYVSLLTEEAMSTYLRKI
jgi:hypothetical protein